MSNDENVNFQCYASKLDPTTGQWKLLSRPERGCHLKFTREVYSDVTIKDAGILNIQLNETPYKFDQTADDTFAVESKGTTYGIQLADIHGVVVCLELLHKYRCERLCELFSKCINTGEVEKSLELLQILINEQLRVSIKSKDEVKFTISVYILSKKLSAATHPYLFEVDPEIVTVRKLKLMIKKECNIPAGRQKVIINRRVADDRHPLKSYKITSSNNKIHVYVTNRTSHYSTNEGLYARQPTLERKGTVKKEAVIASSLSMVISDGNFPEAADLLNSLLYERRKVVVTLIDDTETLGERINIIVRIVNKSLSSTMQSISLDVNPYTMTIRKLKEKMDTDFGIPSDCQRWIIKVNVANDSYKLSDFNITISGSIIYLYVTEPKNPSDEDIQEEEEEEEAVVQEIEQFYYPQREQLQGAAAEPAVRPVPEAKPGWSCPACTFLNLPTIPSCEQCLTERPEDYVVPEDYKLSERELNIKQSEEEQKILYEQNEILQKQMEKGEAFRNYLQLLTLMERNIIPNEQQFECPICYMEIEEEEGVLLRECLHSFCRTCLSAHITLSEDPQVKCPHNDDQYACEAVITDSEIKELLSEEELEKHLQKSINQAEHSSKSFHCRTPDCRGWCLYDDEVNQFMCEICKHVNCIVCRVIHEGKTCKQYQDEIKLKAQNDEDARQTQAMIDEMIRKGDAMKCPQCQIVLQKKSGCDWMRCVMCKTEICWATRGARWGPGGTGDTSGGCKCGVNGQRCSEECRNCH